MKPGAGVPRKKEYKKGVDADDARRKREDNIIELRKNKRDENLQKKRMVNAGPSYAMEDSSARTSLALQNKVRTIAMLLRACWRNQAPCQPHRCRLT
jgi:hypothetical protein